MPGEGYDLWTSTYIDSIKIQEHDTMRGLVQRLNREKISNGMPLLQTMRSKVLVSFRRLAAARS